MKKFFIAILLTLSVASTAFASVQEKLNNRAAAHLAVNYPTAKNVTWTSSDNFEKASFTIANEKIEVYYDAYGDLVGSFKEMAYDKLPKEALEVLTTEYTFPEYQLLECIEFTDADNNKHYYIGYAIDDERVTVEIAANGTVTRI